MRARKVRVLSTPMRLTRGVSRYSFRFRSMPMSLCVFEIRASTSRMRWIHYGCFLTAPG